jgi:glycosyltransferase involved in cell wall biosynthesis
MIAPLIARASGYRTVVTLHELPALTDLVTLGLDRPYGRLAGSLLVRLVLGASVVVVTLDRYRSYLTAHHGARNVLHIPHGAWSELTRAEEPDRETALVFGTFGPHKDPGFVAQAVSQLRRERPRLRLVIAGADHARYPGFLAACRERQWLDAEWIGYVARDELPSLFARATVVVVPGHATTGASGVIHRAIGHGRALVVSDLPDHRALASEQDFGFAWFTPGSADDLGRALGALLQDRPLRNAQVAHNLHSLAGWLPARTAAAYLAVFAGRELARDDAAA